jgi:hypothetical protein
VSAKSIPYNCWLTPTVTRCAVAPSVVPGKYVGRKLMTSFLPSRVAVHV